MMKRFEMMIDGATVATEQTLKVINPATAEPFAECALGTPAHVDQAVRAAKAAFADWRESSDEDRRDMINRIADALEAHMPEFMELVTLETGKPQGGYKGVGAGMEVGGAVAWTRVTAQFDLPVEVIQDNEEARIEVHRKPLGVVGSITPWNWPLLISVWHVIPALRTGNTVVIKPSEYTPVSVLRFVELANEILPKGVLNVVTGAGDVGQAIAQHPDVAKIVFTGSSRTGKRIMENAAGTLKRLTLELGGNDAGIVLADVKPKEIAPALFSACFHNSGQTCAALKRLYVHESIYDDICNELAAIAKTVKVGHGLEQDVELGPLQNARQLDIVKELAEDARRSGGRFLTGGREMDRPGYFYEPTIVADLTNGSRLVDEEPFGPIVPVIKYQDEDEAIRLANDSPNGLGGSIWSSDRAKASELAKRLECGTVWINEHGAVQPDAPFGGIKNSGIGVEFGRYGLEEYTSIQTVKIPK
nr:aldehyde dehydrogenase family protein [Luteithermobacter gelatinilyticus]